MQPRKCEICPNVFIPKVHNQKGCKEECQAEVEQRRKTEYQQGVTAKKRERREKLNDDHGDLRGFVHYLTAPYAPDAGSAKLAAYRRMMGRQG